MFFIELLFCLDRNMQDIFSVPFFVLNEATGNGSIFSLQTTMALIFLSVIITIPLK